MKHGDVLQVKSAIECEGIIEKKIELLESVVAYPNPSRGLFEISIPTSENQVNIELYNILGQLIEAKNYDLSSGSIQINLTSKPKGMYLAKVCLEKPITLKLIKE